MVTSCIRVTSPEVREAVLAAKGDKTWDEYIATAPRTKDGAIIVPRLHPAPEPRKGFWCRFMEMFE